MGAIVFGQDDYDLETYAQAGLTQEDVVWIELSRNKNYWTVQMNNLYFGDEELDLEANQLIFDTGMSFGIIPPNDYKQIKEHLEENYGCQWH